MGFRSKDLKVMQMKLMVCTKGREKDGKGESASMSVFGPVTRLMVNT